MTAKQTEIQEFTASAEIDNGKRSRLFFLLVFEMGQIQLCTKLVFTFVTHPKMHVCSWYGPLTKRNFRIDPCRLFNIFSRVFSAYRIPPRLAGWGIFTISGGSRVQQIRLPPPSQPLLEACKDINFNEGAEQTCLKKVHRKNSWLFCNFSATTVNVCWLRLHSGNNRKKTKQQLFVGLVFLRVNP